MPAGWVLPWPLSGLCIWHLLPVTSHGCPPTPRPPCGHAPGISLFFFFNQDTNYIELGPIHMILFNLNYLFKGPIIKHSHILRI